MTFLENGKSLLLKKESTYWLKCRGIYPNMWNLEKDKRNYIFAEIEDLLKKRAQSKFPDF